MPPYPAKLSTAAEKSLISLGVQTRANTLVTHIDEFGVTVKSGSNETRIAAKTVLWAAGVQASPLGKLLADRTGATLDRAGRVNVNQDLTIPGHPRF